MLINIEQVKIEDRIRKDFGNIQELADDIKQNGLINPPVVMQEVDNTYTLLAGERRIRALKLLGYKQIEVRTWKSLNDEEKLNIEISENEARKDFSKSERMEYALRLAKIEGLKAEERMKSGKADPRQTFGKGARTDEVVAEKLGIGSKENFRKEKYIYENQSSLPPEDFADWDEGRLSTNKAYQQIKAKLQMQSEEISDLKSQVDEAKALRKRISTLESSIKEMEQNKPEVQTVVKQVVPSDYEDIKNSLSVYRSENSRLNKEYSQRLRELSSLKQRLEELESQTPQKQFDKKLKDETIFFCSHVASFLQANGGYVWITEYIDELPERERKSYLSAIDSVGAWYQSIKNSINGGVNEYGK